MIKYVIRKSNININMTYLFKYTDGKQDYEIIAHFLGEQHHTNAQKVCDLLNETSRSQGKYP